MGASEFFTFSAGPEVGPALDAAISQSGHEDGYSYSGCISMKSGDGVSIEQATPVPGEVAQKIASRILQREHDAIERETSDAPVYGGFTAKDGPVGAIAVGSPKAYKRVKRTFVLRGDGNPWREATKRYGDGVAALEVTEDEHTHKVVKTAGPDPHRTKGYEVCNGHGAVVVYGLPSVAAATKQAEELLEGGRHTELHIRRASGVIRFVEKKTKSRRRRVEVTVVTGTTNKIAGWLFFGTAAS